MLETCRKHVADYVENVFSTCFRQDRSNLAISIQWPCPDPIQPRGYRRGVSQGIKSAHPRSCTGATTQPAATNDQFMKFYRIALEG